MQRNTGIQENHEINTVKRQFCLENRKMENFGKYYQGINKSTKHKIGTIS